MALGSQHLKLTFPTIGQTVKSAKTRVAFHTLYPFFLTLPNQLTVTVQPAYGRVASEYSILFFEFHVWGSGAVIRKKKVLA